MSSISQLVHHRWSPPVLAELLRSSGARFVALERRVGVSRESLRRTLAALIDAGLVERNPGYGHPLRPEYVLTEEGKRVAAVCARLLAELEGIEDAALRKWSLPVVAALGSRPRRFSQLRVALPEVSARALSLALKDVAAAGLVERIVTLDYPPATVYRPTGRGRRLASILSELAP
jgi:DNA-binding HxlR family transcriptional regulator